MRSKPSISPKYHSTLTFWGNPYVYVTVLSTTTSLLLQTLYVTEDLMLCDCPGLVFPNFVSSKAEMICNGILPIDQMRDHVPAVSLVCHRIPGHVLEATYGIRLPEPAEGEDPERLPYYHELLDAYGCK